MLELFGKYNLMGVFKGFTDRGLEFSAEIVTPYNAEMIERPQLGQFLLIELGNKEEASLGRITKFVPSGLLATAEGEDYINNMQRRDQQVPEDLKINKLKYKIEIKLLGAVRINKDEKGIKKILYIPSQRRLPHLGANVALPSDEVLKELCALSNGKTNLGHYVLGEFVYSGQDNQTNDIFRHLKPKLEVKFNVNNLVSKRTVVFARAGYGKSNLIKFLISELYKNNGESAITEKGKKVGTLIFDADGEYFWPDHNDRPGLCDVPDLKNQIVVYTNRKAKNNFYNSFVAGSVKLDITKLTARDVVEIVISSDRQNQQNIIKLKSLRSDNWEKIVKLVAKDGLSASEEKIGKAMGFKDTNDDNKNSTSTNVEITAAKSNINNIVHLLHDASSKLIDGTIEVLKQGKIVIVDISLLSTKAGFNIAGLLMRKIFSYNQENFTVEGAPIPVNVIIEESQSVIGKNLDETSPFVEWVKEGRKYDLGAILITQQPGSMAPEIMSQADNWFSFHLLSEADAYTLGKYNSHFSVDILSHIIGEPIPGNCFVWSAPKQPFVLPVRIESFEKLYKENVNKNIENDINNSNENNNSSLVKDINSDISKRDEKMSEELLKRLKEDSRIKIQDKNEYIYIFSGQLYYIIKKIKETNNDTRSENELMKSLMEKIFECDIKIEKIEHETKGFVDHYAVPKDIWQRKIKKLD